MLNYQYLYRNNKHNNSSTALIVLPEIFGINNNIKNIVDSFAGEFGLLTIALDFYYPIDGVAHDLDYQEDLQHAIDLKSKTQANQFIKIFKETLDTVQKSYPNITEFVVCGFCFGGKLAFLSGVDKRVIKIFSFYGAGSNHPFYNNKSAVESLANAREKDSKLIVKGFFGSQDSSIPQEEIALTNQLLIQAGINYQDFVFEAGHAFFRVGGQNYDKQSSITSLEIIKQNLDLYV